MLYRPIPHDFEQQFAQHGWGSICEHHAARWITVRKWIGILGPERLRAARRAHIQEHGRAIGPKRLAEQVERRAGLDGAMPHRLRMGER